MLKRLVCIIIIISVLASVFCLPAFATSSQYPDNPLGDSASLGGVWTRDVHYGPSYSCLVS